MSPRQMRYRILNEPPLQVLLSLSAPLILNQLVQVLYNLADTFWLGKLGRAAVSAPAVSWPVIMTSIFFVSGFSIAGTALLSQYVGANRWERAEKVVGNMLLILLGFALLFGAVGVLFAGDVLRILGVPADVLPLAEDYLRVVALFFPFAFWGAAIASALQAIGDTRTPTVINVFTLTLNLILDPLFIFGWGPFPKLGVTGAAVATGISNLVNSLVGLVIVFRGWRHLQLKPHHLAPDRALISKIFRLGIPPAFSQSFNGLGFTVVMAIVASFGSVATAAYGVGMRIINIISGVVFGISRAASTMIGQNIGADQAERARLILKVAVKVNVVVTSLLAVLVYVFAPAIIRFFVDDPAVVAAGTEMIRVFGLTVPFFGVFFPVMFALRAAGQTRLSALLGAFRLWGLRIPLAFEFSRLWGLNGVWWGLAASNVLSAVFAVALIRLYRDWAKKIID